jgi:hypothetical protein
MVPVRTKRQVLAAPLCAFESHNTGSCVVLLGVRKPHVENSNFDSVAAFLQLQTVTDAGHVATTSLPFVTASDTSN